MSPSTLHAASPAPTNEPLDALVRALERRDILSPRERATLIAAVGDVRTHPAGHVLIRADAPTEASTLLLDGLLSRQYYLPDGKRQIVAAHVSGASSATSAGRRCRRTFTVCRRAKECGSSQPSSVTARSGECIRRSTVSVVIVGGLRGMRDSTAGAFSTYCTSGGEW